MQALMLLHTLHIVYEGHFGLVTFAIAADLSLHALGADSAHSTKKQSI